MIGACRLVELPVRGDSRGALTFAQEGGQIPFSVKRVFSLYDVAPGERRGGHAHLAQHQFLQMVAGSAFVTIDDGRKMETVLLDRPPLALYVPPLHWLDLSDFTEGAVCTVLVSGPYLETDYVRDYAEFLRICGERTGGGGEGEI